MYLSMFAAPWPKRFETILTSSGWETSLGILFLVLGPVLIENRGDALGLYVIVKIVVDLNRRRPAAGADAFNLFEREEPVAGHSLVSDAEFFLEFLVDVIRSAKHATDIGADLHVEFSGRLEAEHGIVGCDVAHIEFGDADALRNFSDDGVGKI